MIVEAGIVTVGAYKCRTRPRFSVLFSLLFMKGQVKERWQEVCEQAAIESNPEKLLKLVAEINRLLHDKLLRLKDKPPGSPNP
jgi:hypothetical protein